MPKDREKPEYLSPADKHIKFDVPPGKERILQVYLSGGGTLSILMSEDEAVFQMDGLIKKRWLEESEDHPDQVAYFWDDRCVPTACFKTADVVAMRIDMAKS